MQTQTQLQHQVREKLLRHINQNCVSMSTTPQFLTVTLRKSLSEYDVPFFSAEADCVIVDGWNISQPDDSNLPAKEWFMLVRTVFKELEADLFSFPVPTMFIIE